MISVVFATHNGERTLPGVLDAYCRIDVPEGSWKLIVVDNASTDRSREIINSYRDRLPLTYLYERKRGKNAALNRAIDHIEGDLVIFTDDDIFPRPGWLVRMRAAADAHPSYAIFGGVILPRWEIPVPGWITEWVPLAVVFAITPSEWTEGPTTPDFVFGGNVAIRSNVFKHGYRFNASIGPGGARYAMGSETEFLWRLVKNNYNAWHVHNAEVEHFIREYQMKKPWILSRAIRYGRGQYRVKRADHSIRIVTWFGVPRYYFRLIIEQAVSVLKCVLIFDHEKLFRERWELNYYRGIIMEARKLHKERTTSSSSKSECAKRTQA
jgi:glycosyltransferase involved in cell wall biosynthesis